MAVQKILWAGGNYAELDAWLEEMRIRRVFLVGGSSLRGLEIDGHFGELEAAGKVTFTRFGGFGPNPSYESVGEGVRRFRDAACDAVIAVGGGSAMDVAKCVKLYANMNPAVNYLKQEIAENRIPLLAVPTTAGSGSEATRYAVIYYKGEKQSITHESIIPGAVLMDPRALRTLPPYQRKATMLDALCHAVESYWSVNSTPESREYSKTAIRMILENEEGYLSNSEAGNTGMLMAAHTAGRAINITQTTAGHAMCYRLTGLYGIAHGHAAALCVSRLWPYMLEHPEQCADVRGEAYLENMFFELGWAMGCGTARQGAEKFRALLSALDMPEIKAEETDIPLLAASVNPVRLKNNPVRLDGAAIKGLYHRILEKTGESAK